MITIKVNQKLINRLRKEGFFPDTMLSAYFAMKALADNEVELLDTLDDYNMSKRTILLYYDLVRKGIWKEEDSGKNLYSFTPDGLSLYNELLEIEEGKKKKIVPVEQWFPAWFELWPKGVESMGKLVRSEQKSCLKKMEKFVKDYPEYSSDLIISATSQYLEDRQKKDWQGTRCAIYFIHHRDSGSDLAAWCEKVKDTGVIINDSEVAYNNGLI